MKKQTKYLILLFLIIFLIKSIISLYYQGIYFFSDEGCISKIGIHLANNFELKTCKEITNAPVGEPLPIYSILLSTVYLFFRGIKSYHAILILNSFIIASLTFPLFSIIKKFIKNNKINFLIIFTTLFLPQIIIYEKTYMTETLFVVINIWFLYFYIKSFEKNKLRNKIFSLLLALLGTFTRPFGFIMILAMTTN